MKLISTALAISAFLLAPFVSAKPDKPNFVVFLVDDMGWGDVAAYDSEYHETPNIDQLASEGMKFNQAYAACAVCSLSRAAILTGQYPARLKLTDWIPGHKNPKGKLNVPDWTMHIEHERVTIAEALNEAGYQTQFIGKWHLLPVPDTDDWINHYPNKHGFDSNIGGREWGQPKGPGKYFHPFGMPNLEGKEGDYLTDALTDAAVDFIETADKDAPFLLYFAYYTVHGPIIAKDDLTAKYASKQTFNENDKTGYPAADKYAAMVQSLDESVGRVVSALEAQGLDKDTVIVFTSDNGGVNARGNNGPFRDGKATPYEGGIREPLIIKWPGAIQAGSENETPVIGTDIYPTLLDIAGLPLKPREHRDGLSLVPLLTQKNDLERDALYWHYPHYHKANPYSAVRDGNLKLIEYFEDGKLELYELSNDPTESQDLAKEQPEVAKRLHKKLTRWRKRIGAQIPYPNPNYDPEATWRRPQG
ncbi:MAG: sulfatase [Opitutales bacterium]|nr:sulfatase [Opitutales bacterium]